MSNSAYFVTTLGAATAVIAIGSASISLGTTAIALLIVALLLLVAGSVLFLRARSKHAAALVLVAAIGVAVASFLPWYGEHVGEPGTGSHRHTMWELGHVH